MPLDPTVAFIFATLFMALVASLVYAYWYQSLKHKERLGKADQSLKVSELESLIRKAVGEAASSLDDRLASLQDEMRSLKAQLDETPDRRRLGPSEETLLVPPNHESVDAPESRAQKRAR